jgi:LEA14-like dessication related protein
MKRLHRILILVLLVPIFSACGILPPSNILPPKLGLSDLGLKEFSLSEVTFTATLAADNPNAFAMPLSDTRLELLLLGQSIAAGVTKTSKIELAASGSTPVPVEFTVSTSKVLAMLRQVGKTPLSQLSYQLKGDTKWGVLGIPLSFDRKGDLDALKKLSDLVR